MSDRELYCDICEGVVLFEAPPCVDAHGADCPDDCSGSRRGGRHAEPEWSDDCSGSRRGGRHAEPEWSELVCTGCGAALLIATFAFRAPRLDTRHGTTRRPHRRAA
ncbi:hypothetical protein ACGFI9_17060 [Micromonospora sp. NPDC048930]|uniref:hypothetical protein n=1 Tax=Micromonospora sp. NPDC048930 TaxID=3364261 RepID=UPI00371EE829